MLEHDRIDSSETIDINKTSDWNKDFTEKKKKWDYDRNWYQNISEGEKQKIKGYGKQKRNDKSELL